MKTCRKCKATKSYSEFDKHEGCIGGVVGTCKDCRRIYQISRKDKDNENRRILYSKDPTKILERNSKYHSKNKEKIKEYISSYQKSNRDKLREYHKEYEVEWRNLNRGKVNAKASHYRATKMKQTPKWLTKEQLKQIEDFYSNCPKGYEVDHIIPLQGENVRGLHVPWNLQYLTVFENRSKNNKIK